MFNIKAKSRYLDLSKSSRPLYVLIVGGIISILAALYYRDILVTITLICSTIGGYFLIALPPEEIKVEITDDSIFIDGAELPWSHCISWTSVDLGEAFEFVIHTSKMTHQFYYFYLSENDQGVQQLIKLLSQYLPYEEMTAAKNPFHIALRNVGLK